MKDYNRKEQQAAKILNKIDEQTVFSNDTFYEEYRQKRLLEMQQAAGLRSLKNHFFSQIFPTQKIGLKHLKNHFFSQIRFPTKLYQFIKTTN